MEVPVVAHALADPERGSGIAMICTFGDLTDVTWWRELQLPTRPIIGWDGRVIRETPAWIATPDATAFYERIAGATAHTAKERMVEILGETGHIDGDSRPITHPVKFFEKGDKPLEIVSSRQWYVRNGGRDDDLRQALIDRGDEMKIGGVVYRVSVSGAYSASQFTLDSAYSGGSDASAAVVYHRSRSTMLITIGDVCDQVSVGVGLDVLSGPGGSCNDTAPYKNTRVNSAQWGNGMSLTVKASADLTSEDRSSVLSTATSTLSGSWGDHAAPAIVSTTASDGGSSPGLNTGDKITVVFDRHTNVPAVSTKTGVDTLLSFSATLGTNYTGVWLSLSVLELELTTVYDRFNDDHTTLNFADISSTAPYQNSTVGTLSVTVKAGGYLQSADLSSVHSTSTDVVAGSWGDHTAPEILSVTASEGGSASESGLGDGDIITVVFDKQTTLNAIDTKIGVDDLFAFAAQIGDDYTAEWTSYTTVRITIVDATHAAAAELTRVGVLRLTVKAAYALQSADESSPVSTSTGVLAGTWLAHSAPVIVSCNASDGGSQEGIGNGDVITVVFDQEINSPAIASKDDVDAVFAFTDPSGAVVSLGADYTGAYAWEPLDATVAVTNGDVEVGCAVDLSTSIFVGDEIKIGGVVYKLSLIHI